MPRPPQPIELSDEDKHYLDSYVSQGKRSARGIKRAQVLRRRHAGQSPQDTAHAVGVSVGTIYNICRRSRAQGVCAAVEEKPRSGQPPKLSLRQEAELTVLACSEAPMGHGHWSVRLLCDKAVELQIVDSVGRETIRQFLKKMNSSRG